MICPRGGLEISAGREISYCEKMWNSILISMKENVKSALRYAHKLSWGRQMTSRLVLIGRVNHWRRDFHLPRCANAQFSCPYFSGIRTSV